MEHALLFGMPVQLNDGLATLSGCNVEGEAWRVDWVVIDRVGLVSKASRRVGTDALTGLEAGRLRADAVWDGLTHFNWHRRYGTLLRPSTRVHFLDMRAIDRVAGELEGALVDDQWQVQRLVVALHGRKLLLPLDHAWLQNDEWVYVDAEQCPPESLVPYTPGQATASAAAS